MLQNTPIHREMAPCPVCGNQDFKRLFEKKQRVFWRCRKCKLECQFPLPTESQMAAYYDQSYRDGMYRDFADACPMKRMTAKLRFDDCHAYCRKGKYLDVGCSNGVFMELLQSLNIEAEGIDISDVAAAAARQRGLLATTTTIENFQAEQPFDTITAFDILEHVIDPLAFLINVRRLLVAEGTLVLCLPNLKSLSHFFMGRRWYFYIPEEHFHYFTPSNLALLLEKTGFEVIHCQSTYKPVTFDYSMIQFQDYNPWIYRCLSLMGKILPQSLRSRSIPLPIGEMMVVARRLPDESPSDV